MTNMNIANITLKLNERKMKNSVMNEKNGVTHSTTGVPPAV